MRRDCADQRGLFFFLTRGKLLFVIFWISFFLSFKKKSCFWVHNALMNIFLYDCRSLQKTALTLFCAETNCVAGLMNRKVFVDRCK